MKLVLHSVSYAGFWPGQARLTLEEFIPHAARLGYDGVMLVAKRPHLSLLDYPVYQPEKRRRLKALADEHGLEIACLAGYTDFTAGSDRPEIPVWEQQVTYVAGLADLARDLGCPAVRIFTSYERPGLTSHATWGRTVEALRECAIQAAAYGVTLAVQNHHDVGVHHESLFQLLTEVDHPNCRAGFDAWSPALQGLQGGTLADAVRRMAPFSVHTTVADYAALPRFKYRGDLVNYVPEPPMMMAVPMGAGIIDYRTFFETLQQTGFPGVAAYEMCSPIQGGGSMENLDRYTRAFLEYMAPYRQAAVAAPAVNGHAGAHPAHATH